MREFCLFCSIQTVEKQRLKKGKKSYMDYEASSEGLKCVKCGGYACRLCLVEVINKFKPIHRTHDRWCREVSKYLEGGSSIPFVGGHCCEWTIQKKLSHVEFSKRCHNVLLPRRFDGYLFLPEYGLLIDSPLNGSVDVHGFGESIKEGRYNHVDGVWHALIPQNIAIELEKQNVMPNGEDLKLVYGLPSRRNIEVESICRKKKRMINMARSSICLYGILYRFSISLFF